MVQFLLGGGFSNAFNVLVRVSEKLTDTNT